MSPPRRANRAPAGGQDDDGRRDVRRRGESPGAALACLGIATACGPGSAEAPQSGGTPVASGSAVAPPGTPGAAKVKHADLLDGISCTGQECTPAGGYYHGISAEHALVELWTGSAWQAERSPDAPRHSSLQAVSCTATANCMAVGSPVIGWNGARWRINRYRRLSAISTCWRASKSSTHLPVPSTTDSSGLSAR